jgi:pyruvate formate lyase activating enzyme
VDTAGNVPWEWIESILPATNLILYDVKCMDDEKHRRVTGVSNRRILENLERLAEKPVPVWVRIPVVPGVNDELDDIRQIAGFLAGKPTVKQVELLPFHHLGSGKFESLGREYPSKGLKPPPDEKMSALVQIVESFGLSVQKMA